VLASVNECVTPAAKQRTDSVLQELIALLEGLFTSDVGSHAGRLSRPRKLATDEFSVGIVVERVHLA
jgi:hypothetical protein